MIKAMKAVVCRRPGELALERRALPTRHPDEVLLRMRRVGICGTDFHIVEGLHPYLDYPRVMGHELSAEVAKAPPGSRFEAGETVIVNPYLACGQCLACRKGRPNCCVRIAVLGVHQDGGMCEWLCLPENNLYPADGLTLDQAAMVEFLAIGAHAVRRAEISTGARVLVVGAGPVGLGVALFARIAGGRVVLMDRRTAPLDFARQHAGIDVTIDAGTVAAADAVARLTDGEGFDFVFDATGNAAAMEAGFGYVAHCGSYVLVGIVKDTITFSDPEFHRKEMSLLASRNATEQDFDRVIATIKAGLIPTAALNTHRCALDDLPKQLPAWLADRTGVVKALVTI